MQDLEKIEKYLNRPLPGEFIKDTGIPVFAPRKPEDDKYDKDFDPADVYTGMHAFGYKLLDTGGTEALYRSISSIILSNLSREKEHLFLDLGCGIGRMLYDLAGLFSNSLFIGMDYSYNMLSRASQILLEGIDITIDLTKKGFGQLKLPGTNPKENLVLIQGNALDIPFNPDTFDCVTKTFLIDRVDDPQEAIRGSVKMLKPGGLFIFSNPMNFKNARGWEKFETAEKLKDFINEVGVRIKEWFDGLIFRGLKDSRRNYTDWQTLIIHGT